MKRSKSHFCSSARFSNQSERVGNSMLFFLLKRMFHIKPIVFGRDYTIWTPSFVQLWSFFNSFSFVVDPIGLASKKCSLAHSFFHFIFLSNSFIKDEFLKTVILFHVTWDDLLSINWLRFFLEGVGGSHGPPWSAKPIGFEENRSRGYIFTNPNQCGRSYHRTVSSPYISTEVVLGLGGESFLRIVRFLFQMLRISRWFRLLYPIWGSRFSMIVTYCRFSATFSIPDS